MIELWYYAEGEETRGPISAGELIALLSKLPDPREVMIWRHGFDNWKPAQEVREIAQQIFRPPPLRSKPPSFQDPAPVLVREPAVDAADAAAFKDVRPEPSGIGGWLILVAIGQVTGNLRLLAMIGEYYSRPEVPQFFATLPVAAWGEAAMNAAAIALFIYTAVSFFRRSRNFPRLFVYQWLTIIFLPVADLLWGSVTIFSARPFFEVARITPQDVAQMVAGTFGAAIWLPYIYRSRRVANTFTR